MSFMNHQHFNQVLKKLKQAPRREAVFQRLLAGETDAEIARAMDIHPGTVRKQIANIYEAFSIKSEFEGDRRSKRNDLIELVRVYNPELLDNPACLCINENDLPTALQEGQDSPFSELYIERPPLETRCYETVVKPGSLLRLRAPQRMGKTWLVERLLKQMQDLGFQTLLFNFQLADSIVFSNLRQFSKWFCATVGQRLSLSRPLEDCWNDIFAGNYNNTVYFETCLLPEISAPLVLALDTVDVVFEQPEIARDFCSLLRGWHEKAGSSDNHSDLWRKLHLIVIHATEVYSSLDINRSPLANVGRTVELREFTAEEVQQFAQRHKLELDAAALAPLIEMVGGHPYLLHLAFNFLQERQGNMQDPLQELLRLAPTRTGIYRSYLRDQLQQLQQQPTLAEAMKQVVSTAEPVQLKPIYAFKLHSMDLVKFQGNQVQPSCDLYRLYFQTHL